MAFVVAKDNLTPEEIEGFVAVNIAPHKKLRGWVEFLEKKIAKSENAKIQRKDLKCT